MIPQQPQQQNKLVTAVSGAITGWLSPYLFWCPSAAPRPMTISGTRSGGTIAVPVYEALLVERRGENVVGLRDSENLHMGGWDMGTWGGGGLCSLPTNLEG